MNSNSTSSILGLPFRKPFHCINWAPINNGLTPTDAYEVVLDPSVPNKLYAATFGGGVFVSIDGGDNWNVFNNTGLANLNISSFAIDPSNPNWLIAGSFGSGIFILAADPPTPVDTIPTMSQWMLFILGLIMASIALVYIKQESSVTELN